MFTVLMIVKIIITIWSLIFMICLYRALKRFLTKVPTFWIDKNDKGRNFKFKLGSKEVEINYRSE